MAFAQRLFQRRPTLEDIQGYASGTLQDQLDENGQPQSAPDRMSGIASSQVQPTTMADRYMATAQPISMADQYMQNAQPVNGLTVPDNRQRQVNPFQQRLMQGRARVADPVNFDVNKLQDLQSQKDPRWEKILNAAAAGVASAAQGGAPIRPIPTRRERDILKAQGQLGQDIAVGREQAQTKALQSQQDAREAAILAGQARIQQGDTRLQNQTDALQQREVQNHRNNLIRTYNGQTDFNPDDPANAGFVAEWQKEFGYKPAKNVRGSQMAVVQGYDADGKPMVSIINKGNQTATQAQGNLPVTTEGQQNRTERQQIVNQQEQGKNIRQQQSIGAADRRQQVGIGATNARMGDPQQMYDKASGMWDEAQQKRAEAKSLGRREAAVKIREAEQLENQTRQLQRQGDRAKAAQGNAPRSANKPAKSLSAIRAAAQAKNLDPDEAERRARARNDITLIP